MNAAQIETGAANQASIDELRASAAHKKLVQFHVGASGSDYAPCLDKTSFVNALAAFLIGAGDLAFFGCGPWHSAIGWPALRDAVWHDEYDKPLGAPLGDAKLVNGSYTRVFASGTTVTLDTRSWQGKIAWAKWGESVELV